MYIVVRSDLPPGLQTAQAVHAAFLFNSIHPFMTEAWHRDSNYVVVLSVPDEVSLKQFFDRIPSSTVKAMVTEPDLDEQMTAFAALGADAGRVLSQLPLALREVDMV